MSKKILKTLTLFTLVFSLVLTACGTASTPTTQPAAPQQPAATEAPMATEAPTATEMPSVDPTGQTITFWHVWGTGLPNETMQAIVDDFNASNEWGITVNALDQGSYTDLENAFNTAIQSGDIPDLVVGYADAIINWYNVGSVVDITPFMNDPNYGLTDAEQAAFFAGSINGGKAPDGALFAFPISQSGNVLFYNTTWAKELGFNNPPTNFAEFKEQACAAAEANNNDNNPDNDGTGGYVLYNDAGNIASFVYANGGDFLNADGTGYDFTNQAVVDTANFLKDLWDSGCALTTESYPNPEFASRKALMVASSTSGLPYQAAAFETEDAIKDDWQIAMFPGKDGGQAVDLFAQYVAITNTNPERELATWLFIKYLTSPEVMAKWTEGSNYYPTRNDTTQFLTDYVNNNPIWAPGLAFLQHGKSEPSWASWFPVRREVKNTFDAIQQGSMDDIPSLLNDLNATAAQDIKDTQ